MRLTLLTFLFLFDRFQLHVMGFIEGIHRAVKYFESSWLLCLSILACCSLLLPLPLLLLLLLFSLLRFACSPSSVSTVHWWWPRIPSCCAQRGQHTVDTVEDKKIRTVTILDIFLLLTLLFYCFCCFSLPFLLSALPSRISLAVLFFFAFCMRFFFTVYCSPSRPSATTPRRMSTVSYHWRIGELARSVIRIVIAPIIIGLCKPALSMLISLWSSAAPGQVSWAWSMSLTLPLSVSLSLSLGRLALLTETLGRHW